MELQGQGRGKDGGQGGGWTPVKSDANPGDSRSTDPHHARVAKDACCKGSTLEQEKGIPAATLSPATNMLYDLERVPFLSGLSSKDSVSIPGCCDSWAGASLTPSATGA